MPIVVRVAVLAVVPEPERRPFATARVELAVGTELESSAGVGGVLEAPILDEHLLGPGLHVPGRAQARDPRAHDTALAQVARACRRRRAVVICLVRLTPDRRRAPDRGVMDIEDVHIRVGRKARVERQALDAAVGEVVNLGAEVREDLGCGVVRVGEDLDDPALLGHEHTAVLREFDCHRGLEAADRGRVLEASRQGEGARRAG